jgi:hypothetical protein
MAAKKNPAAGEAAGPLMIDKHRPKGRSVYQS